MIFITSIISSAEWVKLRDAAAAQFPGEVLARGEVLRRYALAGIEATKRLAEEDMKRKAHELRSSQQVAGPEGDKPRTTWD
jgi:hypothetical protein